MSYNSHSIAKEIALYYRNILAYKDFKEYCNPSDDLCKMREEPYKYFREHIFHKWTGDDNSIYELSQGIYNKYIEDLIVENLFQY